MKKINVLYSTSLNKYLHTQAVGLQADSLTDKRTGHVKTLSPPRKWGSGKKLQEEINFAKQMCSQSLLKSFVVSILRFDIDLLNMSLTMWSS